MATQPNLRAQFPSGPLLDEATGEVLPVWRAYFASLYARTGGAAGASSDTTQLQADLDAEETARQAADLALTTGLAAERAAREAADSAEAAARAGADAQMLPKAGGTMTGMITLSATAPTNPRHAVGKSYVDGAVGGAAYAPLASPMFTGNPTAPTPSPGDADTSLATTAFVAAAVAPTQGNVGRNLIHNSQMAIAQRGAGPFTTNGVYTLDRWRVSISLDTASITQSVIIDADRAQLGDEAAAYQLANNFIGNVGAAAYHSLYQGIEDVRRLAGKTVTFSFYARCGAGALKLGVSPLQYFGSGGSPSAAVQIAAQTATLSTTWARYSMTFVVPSIAGKTLGTANDHATFVSFYFSSGTTNATAAGNPGVQSGVIVLWGVQLEIGSVATPLEKPDPQVELANCQRYYQTGYVTLMTYNAAGSVLQTSGTFATFMRASPTMVIVGSPSLLNAAAPSFPYCNNNNYTAQAMTTALGHTEMVITFTASADL